MVIQCQDLSIYLSIFYLFCLSVFVYLVDFLTLALLRLVLVSAAVTSAVFVRALVLRVLVACLLCFEALDGRCWGFGGVFSSSDDSASIGCGAEGACK